MFVYFYITITSKIIKMVSKQTKRELLQYGKVLSYNQKQHISVITENSLSTTLAYFNGDCAKEKTASELLNAAKEMMPLKAVA